MNNTMKAAHLQAIRAAVNISEWANKPASYADGLALALRIEHRKVKVGERMRAAMGR